MSASQSMTTDPFDDLLSLEDQFYQEGYSAGLADGEYAGMVEGKVFGIEKGYERAFELARLHGRALVWQARFQPSTPSSKAGQSGEDSPDHVKAPLLSLSSEAGLPKNNRLTKHIDGLLAATEATLLSANNSDEAVTEFDQRISKAQAKAKVIAAIVSEPLNLEVVESGSTGIEESRGLNARH